VAELADALASGASDRKIIGVRLSSSAQIRKIFMSDCIFCKIANKEVPSFHIWDDNDLFAFLDIQPMNPGHILIIPKKHAETIYDLPNDIYEKLFTTARALSAPLQRATGSKKIGLAVEGFGVAHAHVHLVPLHQPNELDPHRAQRMDDDELQRIAEKIKKELTTEH
jgi:histidine triad (HIT) family protein